MIEDFDGPDPAPVRRTHVRVISTLLVLGAVAGYAIVSEPQLRGPFATPGPAAASSAAPWPTFATEYNTFVFNQAGGEFTSVPGPACVVAPTAPPDSIHQIVFLGEGATTTPIDVRSLPTCPPGFGVRWGQPPNFIPPGRASP